MADMKLPKSPNKYAQSTYNDLLRTLQENAFAIGTPGIVQTFSDLIKRITADSTQRNTFSALRQLRQLGRPDVGSVEGLTKSIQDTGERGMSSAITQKNKEVRTSFEQLINQLMPVSGLSATPATVPKEGMYAQMAGGLLSTLGGMGGGGSNKGMDLSNAVAPKETPGTSVPVLAPNRPPENPYDTPPRPIDK